jgi:methyl-accepting chemotaxis protein
MDHTASAYRPVSTLHPVSGLKPVTRRTVAPGLTPPPRANGLANGAGAWTEAPRAASAPARDRAAAADIPRRATPSEAHGTLAASTSLADVSIKVRLIAAFVLIACAAIATAMINGMELDGVIATLPGDLTAAQRDAITDAIAQARIVGYVAAAITAATAVGLGIVIALSIADPIQRITRAMSKLAAGDTDVEIPQARNADEIGVMAGTIATFKENTLEVQRLTQEREEEMRRQAAERRAIRERMGNELESTVTRMVDNARTEVNGLQLLAEQLFEAQTLANRRASEVNNASKRASEIAASFSGSVDDLSGAITDIEQRVEQTTDMSDQAAEDAREADTEINALVEAADSITKIIDLIRDIAGKTNMLALNATVEAVRAGEAGRSFQVVAQEIKNLSRQTADATEQVEGIIGDIRSKTGNTAKRVRGIIDVVGMINTAAADIKGAVEQQSRTAEQISADAKEASEQTQVMEQSIQSVAQQTQEIENSASKVRNSANSVGDSVDAIRDEVDRFLETAVKADHA